MFINYINDFKDRFYDHFEVKYEKIFFLTQSLQMALTKSCQRKDFVSDLGKGWENIVTKFQPWNSYTFCIFEKPQRRSERT